VSTKLDPPRLWTPPTNGTAHSPSVGPPRFTRDHMQLPYKDDSVTSNLLENPQSFLLTTTLDPVLARRHPDGLYCVGGDNYIYFDDVNPAPNGAKSTDW
jgi:hypothetical protein